MILCCEYSWVKDHTEKNKCILDFIIGPIKITHLKYSVYLSPLHCLQMLFFLMCFFAFTLT